MVAPVNEAFHEWSTGHTLRALPTYAHQLAI